jgi:hypothetical protein
VTAAPALVRRPSRLGRAALAYADRLGWRVVPEWPLRPVQVPASPPRLRCACGEGARCPSAGKHPRLVRWQEHATTDLGQIERWWTETPDAGIGIATGAASGIVLVDVDVSGDKRGGETLWALQVQHDDLPLTPTARSGSGGEHRVFAHPGEGLVVPNKQALGPGLDIRGDGGQFVASPSPHLSGQSYQWKKGLSPLDVPLAHLPDWLLRMLSAGPPSPHVGELPPLEGLPPEAQRLRRARAYLAAAPLAVPGQGADSLTFQLARDLVRGFCLAPEAALDLLAAWNARCVKPWPDRRLAYKVSQATAASTLPWGYKLRAAR